LNVTGQAGKLATILGLSFVGVVSAQTELPTATRIVGISNFAEFPGTHRISLTFDGSQAMVFWERGRASLFSVDDLIETPLSVDPRCIGLRSNSQQDGYYAFIEIGNSDPSKNEIVPRFRPTTISHADMLYFRDLESLKAWTPAWTLSRVSSHRLLFFQMAGSERFAVVTAKKNSLTKREIALVNVHGKIEGRIEVDGNIIGLEHEDEEHKNELIVYYIVATDDPFVLNVKSARIDKTFKMRDAKTLYNLVLPEHGGGENLQQHRFLVGLISPRYGQSCCQQAFRLRLSRPGDARRFVSEILPQRDYFKSGHAVPNVGLWESSIRGRLANYNQVAAFDSESAFELMRFEARTGSDPISPSFWNRKGEIGYVDNKSVAELTESFQITDAVMNGEGGIIVHSRSLSPITVQNREIENRQELGISYVGNRIPKGDKVAK